MCNFYMMFYWDATSPDPFPDGAVCVAQDKHQLVSEEYPVEGTVPFERHLDWEHEAHQSKSFGKLCCSAFFKFYFLQKIIFNKRDNKTKKM